MKKIDRPFRLVILCVLFSRLASERWISVAREVNWMSRCVRVERLDECGLMYAFRRTQQFRWIPELVCVCVYAVHTFPFFHWIACLPLLAYLPLIQMSNRCMSHTTACSFFFCWFNYRNFFLLLPLRLFRLRSFFLQCPHVLWSCSLFTWIKP